MYTEKHKAELVAQYCAKVSATDIAIVDICDELAVDPYTIQLWAKNDKKIKEQRDIAMQMRAWRYAKKARETIENCETTLTDSKGSKRDHNAAVNKAKHVCDFYMRMASILAPDVFGDLRHEIKEIQREITALRRMIEQKNKT